MIAQNLIGYWRSLTPDERIALAREVDVTVNHLRVVAGGHRNASDNLVGKLCAARKEINQLWFL